MNRINEKKFYDEIGRRLKERRQELDLTQGEVTARLGMERTSLAHIEAARQRPSLHQLVLLCHELIIDPAQVLPRWDDVALTDEDNREEAEHDLEIQIVGTGETLTAGMSAFLRSAQQSSQALEAGRDAGEEREHEKPRRN